MSPSRVSVLLLTLATTLLFGCGKLEELRHRYTPKTPREDYVRGLEETGLMGTVLGKAWTSVAEVHMLAPDSGRIFLDLFHLMDGVGLGLRRVALADSMQALTLDATRTGSYILRMQPELLAGGRYSLSIRQTSSIIFPVSGGDTGDIGSWFGDPRDAGRRDGIFTGFQTGILGLTDRRAGSGFCRYHS